MKRSSRVILATPGEQLATPAGGGAGPGGIGTFRRQRGLIDPVRAFFLLIIVGVICGTLFGTDSLRTGGSLQVLDVLVLRPIRGAFYLSQGWPLLGLLVLALVGFASTRQYRGRDLAILSGTGPVTLLLGYVAVLAVFSPYPDAVAWRFGVFQVYVLPLILAGILLGAAKGVAALRYGFLVFGVLWLVVVALRQWGLSPPSFLDVQDPSTGRLVLESDFITTAQACFASSLAFLLSAWGTTKKVRQLGLGGLGLALAFVGLQTGARGPLLGFLVVALAFAVLALSSWKQRTVVVMALAVALVVIGRRPELVVTGKALEHFRWEDVQWKDESFQIRAYYFSQALHAEPSLFGSGLGAGSAIGFGSDDYVHNLVLEMYVEGGIVGLSIMCAAFWYCTLRIWRNWKGTRSLDSLFLILLLAFYLMCGQFSGTLLGTGGLWLVMTVGCTACSVRTARQVGQELEASDGRS